MKMPKRTRARSENQKEREELLKRIDRARRKIREKGRRGGEECESGRGECE